MKIMQNLQKGPMNCPCVHSITHILNGPCIGKNIKQFPKNIKFGPQAHFNMEIMLNVFGSTVWTLKTEIMNMRHDEA